MVQKRDGRGQAEWDWGDPANRSGKNEPGMVFEGTRPELVELYRAQYDLWWLSLQALVPLLNEALKAHEAIWTGRAALAPGAATAGNAARGHDGGRQRASAGDHRARGAIRATAATAGADQCAGDEKPGPQWTSRSWP